MLAQVKSSGVTHISQAPCSVSIMCQHRAQSHAENCDILLYIFNPWPCLTQWNHHRWFVFNYYICFCGNIFKSKLILTKEEENMKVKRKQKYFYYVYLYKSVKCKQGKYFIKHVARVPQRISQLFQWEKVSSKSFFPSLICLAYQGLSPPGFKSVGKFLSFASVPHCHPTSDSQ